MKILMVNKFLFPKGGAETYMLKLGAYLESQGHSVEYFGMADNRNIVSNRVDMYTTNMDFYNGSVFSKAGYAFKTVYSLEAKRKITAVLEDFNPDIVHLNNFNYQLTPSIILAIRQWEKAIGGKCRIIYTAHDYQLICPNHICRNGNHSCEKCLTGSYINCLKHRCIHGSFFKSAVGTVEAALWNWLGVYRHIDEIICCSDFLKTKLDTSPILAQKTITLHNFIDNIEKRDTEKREYVLYFGRFSKEKGIETLVSICKQLPHIPFVFAGAGSLEKEINRLDNITNMGFVTGARLEMVIRKARFSVYPSEWYENCPLSVMESIACGTPVIGADIGGIPELIDDGATGELFESGNAHMLKQKIENLWVDREKNNRYIQNCKNARFISVSEYSQKIYNRK